MNGTPSLNFGPLVQFLRKSWLLMCVFALLGGGVAVAYVVAQTPQYEATSHLYVYTERVGVAAPSFHRKAVESYADIATSPTVLDPVIDELGLKETAAQLASHIEAEAPSDIEVIAITATDPQPVLAARIADGVSGRLAQVSSRLSQGAPSPLVKLVQLDHARPSTTPTSPNAPVTLILGLLIGVGVAILVAALRGRSGGGRVRMTPAQPTT